MSTDPASLVEAGFSQEEANEYVHLENAGFSGAEIEKYYMDKKGGGPTTTQKVLRAVSPYARPLLEGGGMMFGAAAAAPASMATVNPAPSIAGGALGYAGGKLIADYIDEKAGMRESPDMVNRIGDVGVDLTTGALGGMTGAAASSGVNMLGKALSKQAEPLYSRAIKTPLGERWRTLYPEHEYTAREAAVKAGLGDRILPNKFGLARARARVDEVTKAIDDEVTRLSKPRGGSIPNKRMTKAGDIVDELQGVKGEAASSSSSAKAKEAVSEIEQEIVTKAGVSSKLSPQQLQNIKKQFYDEIEWDKAKPIIDVKGQFTQKARKAVAEAAMKRLSDLSPELNALNKESAAYIDLKKAIEYTIDRELQNNMVGFGAKMIALRNMGIAAMDTFLGLPANKARLAFAIHKGSQWTLPTTTKAVGVGATQAMEGEDSRRKVIRYDLNGRRVQ